MKLNKQNLSHAPDYLDIEDSEYGKSKIRSFRETVFANKYKEPFPEDDYVFDQSAVYLCSKSHHSKQLMASSRVVIDSTFGLPCQNHDHGYIDSFRDAGKLVGEPGNLVITDSDLIPKYLVTMFEIAGQFGVSDYFFTTKNNKFYQRVLSAKSVIDDIGFDYSSRFKFSLMHWNINSSREALSQYANQEL